MGFILRDYLSPQILVWNNAASLKNIYKRMAPKRMLGGILDINGNMTSPAVECYDFIRFRGKGVPVGVPYGANGIRDDKDFNKFCRLLGINREDLEAEHYDGTESVYMEWGLENYTFVPAEVGDLAARINDEYFNIHLPDVSAVNTFAFEVGSPAGTVVGSITIDPTIEKYTFSSGAYTTADGMFTITKSGQIVLTQAGSIAYKQISYTNINYTIYTIEKTDTSNVVTTSSIIIHRKKEYIELEIKIGGEWTANVSIVSGEVQAGTSDMASNLAAVRAAVEADPDKYLGGIYNYTQATKMVAITSGMYLKTGTGALSSYVGTVDYVRDGGHLYDITALYTYDSNIVERQAGIFNEKTTIVKPVIQQYRTSVKKYGDYDQPERYTLQYSYTLRYKLLRKPVSTDVYITKLQSAAVAYKELIVNAHDARIGNIFELGTVMLGVSAGLLGVKTPIQSMLAELNTPTIAELGDLNSIFYYFESKLYLRTSALDAMNPLEFYKFMGEYMTLGYTEEPKNPWESFGAFLLVVVVIAAAILSENPYAFAYASALLSGAGYLYFKWTNNGFGAQLIGIAAQITGIVSILQGIQELARSGLAKYAAYESAKELAVTEFAATEFADILNDVATDMLMDAAEDAATLAMVTASTASQFGALGEDAERAVGIAGLAFGTYQGLTNLYSSISLSMQSLFDTLKLFSNGMQLQLALTTNAVKSDANSSEVEDDQAKDVKPDALYYIREMTYDTDALCGIDRIKDNQVALAQTDRIIQNMVPSQVMPEFMSPRLH